MERFYIVCHGSETRNQNVWELHDRALGGQSYVGKLFDNELADKIVDLLNREF